jgi:hypothetical protein
MQTGLARRPDPPRRMAQAPDPKIEDGKAQASDPWSDLVLTLPMFLGYHLGVVFLPIRNAADVVTRELVALVHHDMSAYAGLTLGIGLVYVTLLGLAGRGHALRWQRFSFIAAEGVLYAVALRFSATYLVGSVFLSAPGGAPLGTFDGAVMSLGAGFYEEIAFRVLLFGVGLKALSILFPPSTALGKMGLGVFWALVSAAVFSGWHYVGALGDTFQLESFLFRVVCGFAFVLIYAFRGFAPAVWTHTLYDLWVMVL